MLMIKPEQKAIKRLNGVKKEGMRQELELL